MTSMTQETIDQSVEQANQVLHGAQLNTALKTEAGKVLANALVQGIADLLDAIVWDQSSDEEVLRNVYKIRGITGSIEPIGDAIKMAIAAVARNAVNQKLRGRTLLNEEG